MKIDFLAWDSSFFELNIGKSILKSQDELDDTISNSKYDLVYLFSENPITNLFCIDEKLEFKKEVNSFLEGDAENVLVWKNGLNEDLIKLAILSGHSSRFKADAKLSKKFEQLYHLWIEKSINGDLADYVLVAIENEEILGVMTLKLHDHFSRIGLVAVKDEAQGKGIGSNLMNKALQLTMENNKRFIKVVTQEQNTGAMKYYSKNGFLIHKKEYIYHYWLKKTS